MNDKEIAELDKSLRDLMKDLRSGAVEWRLGATINDTAGKRIKLFCAQIARDALASQLNGPERARYKERKALE